MLNSKPADRAEKLMLKFPDFSISVSLSVISKMSSS